MSGHERSQLLSEGIALQQVVVDLPVEGAMDRRVLGLDLLPGADGGADGPVVRRVRIDAEADHEMIRADQADPGVDVRQYPCRIGEARAVVILRCAVIDRPRIQHGDAELLIDTVPWRGWRGDDEAGMT